MLKPAGKIAVFALLFAMVFANTVDIFVAGFLSPNRGSGTVSLGNSVFSTTAQADFSTQAEMKSVVLSSAGAAGGPLRVIAPKDVRQITISSEPSIPSPVLRVVTSDWSSVTVVVVDSYNTNISVVVIRRTLLDKPDRVSSSRPSSPALILSNKVIRLFDFHLESGQLGAVSNGTPQTHYAPRKFVNSKTVVLRC